MVNTAIPDIVHAQLHTRNKKAYFESKMSVPEFVQHNRPLLNEIYKYMNTKYQIDTSVAMLTLFMEEGVKQYLVAEGILK